MVGIYIKDDRGIYLDVGRARHLEDAVKQVSTLFQFEPDYDELLVFNENDELVFRFKRSDFELVEKYIVGESK